MSNRFTVSWILIILLHPDQCGWKSPRPFLFLKSAADLFEDVFGRLWTPALDRHVQSLEWSRLGVTDTSSRFSKSPECGRGFSAVRALTCPTSHWTTRAFGGGASLAAKRRKEFNCAKVLCGDGCPKFRDFSARVSQRRSDGDGLSTAEIQHVALLLRLSFFF